MRRPVAILLECCHGYIYTERKVVFLYHNIRHLLLGLPNIEEATLSLSLGIEEVQT